MRIIIGILFTICFSQIAFAEPTYVCTQGSMERQIEVVYLGADTVPCDVRYTKEGETKVLWSAQAEEGYCEAKAVEFVEKQRGWGWECAEKTAVMSEPTDMGEPAAPLVPEELGLE